jgi:hypothetical protein
MYDTVFENRASWIWWRMLMILTHIAQVGYLRLKSRRWTVRCTRTWIALIVGVIIVTQRVPRVHVGRRGRLICNQYHGITISCAVFIPIIPYRTLKLLQIIQDTGRVVSDSALTTLAPTPEQFDTTEKARRNTYGSYQSLPWGTLREL